MARKNLAPNVARNQQHKAPMRVDEESNEDQTRALEALWEKLTGVRIVRTTETTKGNEEEIRAMISQRRVAREKRRAEREERAIKNGKAQS